MNYSDNLKYVWCGYGACGSKSMSGILETHFDLQYYGRNTPGIPEGKEDYEVIVNFRNPYHWILSGYLDNKGNGFDGKFEDFVEQVLHYKTEFLCQSEILEKCKPKFIRCENMYSDVLKIPVLAKHLGEGDKDYVKEVLNNPNYKSHRKPTTKLLMSFYWNNKLANKFYKETKPFFKMAKYLKNSWKTGIHWRGYEACI